MAAAGGKFSGVLGTLRKIYLGRRYEIAVQDIQKAFRCSRRTAERIYAGQMVSGDVVLAGLVSEFGTALIEEALLQLDPEQRAVVALALRDACNLVRMQAEQEAFVIQKQREAKR